MNKSNKVLKLRQEILKANTKLEQIKKSGLLEDSVEANTKYNQILIERAIYKKELNTSKTHIVKKIFDKLFQNNKNERLICDYFKS